MRQQEEVIGYVINEDLVSEHELRNVKPISKNVVRMTAVLQEANLPNRNKRIYSKEAINEGITSDYIREKLKTRSLISE
jgi:hypothetical protein